MLVKVPLAWWPALSLTVAYILDLLLGDPRWFPHPVRIAGRAISFLESLSRRIFKSSWGERMAGAAIVLLVAGGSSALTNFMVIVAGRLHFILGLLLFTLIFYTMLATKDLGAHVKEVLAALEGDDLLLARRRVALLVSRDTESLTEEGVLRAALESLFENTADGVVAPLFYAALGGPALAVLYKSVNTMDSMLGYKNERYLNLGWAAARSDDVLSYIPARLAALIFLLAGMLQGRDWKRGWKVLVKDRKGHESPNSAWPEAAAAGLLGVRLGGDDYYGGKKKSRPLINEGGKAPRRDDLVEALKLFRLASCLSLAGALPLSLITGRFWGVPW